jgi:hypothetical protein
MACGTPPAAGTRQMPSPAAVANRIVSSAPHDALATDGASPILRGVPPSSDTLCSASPAWKPTHRPSGEKNGAVPPSVPLMTDASKRSRGRVNNCVRDAPSAAA